MAIFYADSSSFKAVTITDSLTISNGAAVSGTSSYATNAGNASAIDISSFGSNVESYLLMSNVIATTGIAVGGDTELRYNASTNKLSLTGTISATSITASVQGTASWATNFVSASNYVLNSSTSSFIINNQTSSFSTTGSNTFNGNQIISGSISISGSSVQAPLQVGSGSTSLLYVSSSGNVGVGTITPAYKLDVNGTGNFSGAITANSGILINGSNAIGITSQFKWGSFSTAQATFKLTNAGGNIVPGFVAYSNNVAGTAQYALTQDYGFLASAANASFNQVARAAIQISASNNTAGSEAGDLIFLTQTGGTAISEKMRITGAGNLGIGTTTPNATFHNKSTTTSVNTTVESTRFDITSTGITSASFGQSLNFHGRVQSTDNLRYAYINTDFRFITSAANQFGGRMALGIVNNGVDTTGITMDGNGGGSVYSNVATVVSSTLGINGQIRTTTGGTGASFYRTGSSAADLTANAYFGATSTNNIGDKSIALDTTNSRGLVFVETNGSQRVARASVNYTSTSNTANAEGGDLIFSTKQGNTATTERMRIKDSGSIGIGTATPNATLDISGSLNISGSGLQIPFQISSGSTSLLFVSASGTVVLSSGSVTMPNRPAFRVTGAGGGKSSTTVLSGSYLNVDYQQGSGWDNTTGTFTAPIAGLYQVNLVVRTNSNSLGTISQLIVYKNNTTISPGPDGTPQVMVEFGANTTMNHAGGSTISKLAVGDTLKMIVAAGQISFDVNDNFSVAYIG